MRTSKLEEPWMSDAAAVDVFIREARRAAMVTNGVIVDMSLVVRDARSDSRTAVALPQGYTFARLLTRVGAMRPLHVVSLLRPIAAAMDRLHAEGLVHHDIRPENLLLVSFRSGNYALRILGFGLQGTRLRLRGRRLDILDYETIEFMPPEALTGRLPDWRGDVYSLAVTGFELMTGTTPFAGFDMEEQAWLKTNSRPRRLTEATGKPFPKGVEVAMARGLSSRPADRPSASGLVASWKRGLANYDQGEQSGPREANH